MHHNDRHVTENDAARRAILVAVDEGTRAPDAVERSLDELEDLAMSCGLTAVARVVQRLDRVDGATFVGSGKLEEINALADELDADHVIFDGAL